MEERQVYFSFEESEYKSSKAELLRCRANLVNIQKSLQQLEAIRSNKKRLIGHLTRMVSGSESIVSRLNSKMPDDTMPASIRNKVSKNKAKLPKMNKTTDKVFSLKVDSSELDKELTEINRRLKELL